MNRPEIRYKISSLLRKTANKIYSKSIGVPINIIPNIGAKDLPKDSKRALLIYNIAAVRHWIEGKSFDLSKHTIHWESIEMVKLLNRHGYAVDFADERSKIELDFSKYALIIDNLNNLKDVGLHPGQKKVHWTTYNHWLRWNSAELERLRMFQERTGIVIPMNRQLPTILSDEYADYLTYFGTDLQKGSFSNKPKKVQIDISSAFVPEYRKKNIEKARNRFLWMGGGGMVHKGLDIVIEAFTKLPDAELYILSNMEDPTETRFWRWAKPIIAKHPNIHSMGRMDLTSPQFDELADGCIGAVYASCAEGGPGSTARAIHNGLVPIVTPSSLVRAEVLGFNIDGKTDTEMIESTLTRVQQVMNLPEKELLERSDAVRDFARKHHTRQAFSESFSKFIEQM